MEASGCDKDRCCGKDFIQYSKNDSMQAVVAKQIAYL